MVPYSVSAHRFLLGVLLAALSALPVDASHGHATGCLGMHSALRAFLLAAHWIGCSFALKCCCLFAGPSEVRN